MSKSSLLFFVLFGISLLIIYSGCHKVNPAKPFENQPPETQFVNIPPAGDTISYRTELYWIGNDADGAVIGYEYVIDDTNQSWHFVEATQETIQFLCPNYIDMHILYVRAMDDDSLVDTTPAARAFNAQTIAPSAQITRMLVDNGDTTYAPAGADTFWNPKAGDTVFSLPQTTETWRGIRFCWNGSDTLDPDGSVVGYFWKVDNSDWNWTTDTTANVVGLSPGLHTFYLRAKDNAQATTPVDLADSRTFYVVQPTFDQGILLLDETWDASPTPDAQVDSFYHDLLDSAGRHQYKDWDKTWVNPPSHEDLGPYSTIIYYNDDLVSFGMETSHHTGLLLREYLDVGGKIWFTGPKNFSNLRDNCEFPVDEYLGLTSSSMQEGKDFIGVFPLTAGYDTLTVDPKFYGGKIGGVSVFTFGSWTSGIFGFNSDGNIGDFEGMPCAVQADRGTYKAVLFDFPFYFMSPPSKVRTTAKNVLEFLE